jgi:transcriptional regulator with XRE-family HTH domain
MPLNRTKLIALRHRAKLRQIDLAAKAGITPCYLVQLERGAKQSPTLGVIERLAAALGTTAAKLIEEKKP